MARRESLGLSVVDSRLWLRARRRRGARLRFEPTGLVVTTPEADCHLAWESYSDAVGPRPGWECSGRAGSRYHRAAVTVDSDRRSERASKSPQMRQWSVPASWLSFRYAWAEVPALAAYLAATPPARQALGNAARLVRLVEAIRSGPLVERPLPGAHATGDQLDVDIAIQKVLTATGVRLFRGRPVRGEPVPSPADLVPEVRQALPHRVEPNDDVIDRQIARLLEVRPWPFDALVEAEPPSAYQVTG